MNLESFEIIENKCFVGMFIFYWQISRTEISNNPECKVTLNVKNKQERNIKLIIQQQSRNKKKKQNKISLLNFQCIFFLNNQT